MIWTLCGETVTGTVLASPEDRSRRLTVLPSSSAVNTTPVWAIRFAAASLADKASDSANPAAAHTTAARLLRAGVFEGSQPSFRSLLGNIACYVCTVFAGRQRLRRPPLNSEWNP